MCDIYVPLYLSRQGLTIRDTVIDFHGYHHFMRNCARVKGGSALKGKIMRDEGQIYEYISVDEWNMSSDKK